jgi:hypothetical protein
MSAGVSALVFGLGALTYGAVVRVNLRRHPPVDAVRVRAQALADAWEAVRTCQHGPAPFGPADFYHGVFAARVAIEDLPGFDFNAEPKDVFAYRIRRNSTRDRTVSGMIKGDGPGGVGSTNRGLTPTTDITGSES